MKNIDRLSFLFDVLECASRIPWTHWNFRHRLQGSRKRASSGASTLTCTTGFAAARLSLSLHETKSYLLKRLRAAPDTTGGPEYGGQSVPGGVSRCGRKL